MSEGLIGFPGGPYRFPRRDARVSLLCECLKALASQSISLDRGYRFLPTCGEEVVDRTC